MVDSIFGSCIVKNSYSIELCCVVDDENFSTRTTATTKIYEYSACAIGRIFFPLNEPDSRICF